MTPELEPTPLFADEAEERAYWESHDSTAHIEWERAEWAVFPKLKLTAPGAN